jgi:hypothetical protein
MEFAAGWRLKKKPTTFVERNETHYQSVRYVKLCHAVGVVAVGKLDKVYQSLRVHLFLRNVLTIV